MFQKVIGQKPDSDNNNAGASTKPTSPSSASAPKSSPASSTPASSPRPAAGGRNVLSSDVEINGTIKFSNDLVVDGKIEGHITSNGSLTVGENARIKAEVKTNSVIVYGKVHGNIECTGTVELKANAELVGDVKAASLSIEPGAIFVGRSAVGTPSVKPQQQQSSSNNNKSGGNKGGSKLANAS